jgi:PmbA protein
MKMDILKELHSTAEQVEVVEIRNETTSVEFEHNKLKSSKVEETSGLAVRVVRHGKLGFAASSDVEAIDRLTAGVLESASYGDPTSLQFPASKEALPVKTYDPKIVNLPIPQLVQIGQEILELILSTDAVCQVNISLNRGVQELRIRNQAGADVQVTRSPLSIGVEIDRIEGDDVLILYDSSGVTCWEENYMAFTRQLADKLVKAQTLVQARSGKFPVLFSPSGGVVYGIPLLEGLNAKNVYTGISPMKGKVGEKLFDQKLTLIDDPTLDGRYSSAPYDDEGMRHRTNVFIENGVLNGFYCDLKTAALSGLEPTGNGRRSLFYPPGPAPTNLVLAAGETPLAEMISSIDEGYLIDGVLGLGQGNVVSGAFSNPVALGFKIEKGEIVGRVKDISIADNIYELLKEITAVSQERDWIYNDFLSPYMLVPEMNIVAKQ